jgi:hypothetical protein
MKHVVVVLAILAALRSLPRAQAREAQDPTEAIKEAMTRSSEGRFQAALRSLEEHHDLLREDPQAQYVAGTALMRLHRPDQAKPLLTAAAEKGIAGFEGWDSTEALLARIAVVDRLRPRLAKGLPQDDRLKALHVYADDTPWIQGILEVLPRHVARAQEVFGKDLPPVNMYLFRSREDYTAFYQALFSANIPTSWQNGTGNSNVVTFCQADREGRPVGAPGTARGRGDVLHEYGHALLHTLYGDLYLRHVPQWFDEGVSDFLAREYYKELFEYSADLIRRAAIVPSLEDLTRHLYERDPSLRYGMARYMVDELLQGREPSILRDILRRAAADGKFEEAIQTTTGLGSSDLHKRVIARFR